MPLIGFVADGEVDSELESPPMSASASSGFSPCTGGWLFAVLLPVSEDASPGAATDAAALVASVMAPLVFL